MAKGSDTTEGRRRFVADICRAYPDAQVVVASNTPHNRVRLGPSDPLELHYEGKRTLVLAEHQSAVRESGEEGNSCPNYWHFSPYGFCPYGCDYCYLAGTQGVRFSPTVKIFVNLSEILGEIDRTVRWIGQPTAFYLGKLQDGLALDPLTGYTRRIVPFFADHPLARLTLLTKSANVDNLLDLEHGGHSVLSWTVNPAAIADDFEHSAPPVGQRIAAMARCARAGYPVRAVVMPIIPIEGWEEAYGELLVHLLGRVRLSRITLGSICSYPEAMRLTERKLGPRNAISTRLDDGRTRLDGRARFPRSLREKVYRRLIETVRGLAPDVEIGLCLEEPSIFESLGLSGSRGRCNCVL